MNYRGIVLGAIVLIGIVLVLLTQQEKDGQRRKAIVGLEAPEFSLLDRDGTEITLSQYRGKTVFVHFWATWCKECKTEMPEIQALYNRKKNDPNYVFITVGYNEDPKISGQWLRDNNYTIPLYVDKSGQAAVDYGLTGVPETFVIDPDGILKTRILGPTDWNRF
jgi:cytochrome c biogenesis protein CcmG/thiol:disulfide interchange protein DsbE